MAQPCELLSVTPKPSFVPEQQAHRCSSGLFLTHLLYICIYIISLFPFIFICSMSFCPPLSFLFLLRRLLRLVVKGSFWPPHNKQCSDSRVADMETRTLHLFPVTSITMRSCDLTGCINYDRMQVSKLAGRVTNYIE